MTRTRQGYTGLFFRVSGQPYKRLAGQSGVRRTAPTPMQVQEIPAITLKTLSRYPTYRMLLGRWG
ncbi:MAG: hypothetical protein RQ862_03690 [Candidatus Caldarchaeales archaeon]|nr:hypothetical protein [Candidatus Caldarchaeales archaeon]